MINIRDPIHGTVSLGRLDGNLLREARMTNLRIVDSLGMPFKAGLAPSYGAVVGFDPNKQPAWRDVEGLNSGNFHRCGLISTATNANCTFI